MNLDITGRCNVHALETPEGGDQISPHGCRGIDLVSNVRATGVVGCRIFKVPLSNVSLGVRHKDSGILLKVMDEPIELLNIDLLCLRELILKVLSYFVIPGMLLPSIKHYTPSYCLRFRLLWSQNIYHVDKLVSVNAQPMCMYELKKCFIQL